MFKDRKIDFKEFELSTVTDYAGRKGKPTDIVNFPPNRLMSTVKKDLADHTGMDTLPQIFISGKYRGDDKKITESFENGDIQKWMDEEKVKIAKFNKRYEEEFKEQVYKQPGTSHNK